MTLTIGEVAEEADVQVTTVRYYERRGLIPEPPRRPSGYREYAHESVRRIRFIRSAQELGFSLNEIKELLELWLNPATTCVDVQQQGEAKLAQIAAKIQTLQRMQAALTQLLAGCESDNLNRRCNLLSILEMPLSNGRVQSPKEECEKAKCVRSER